MMYRCHELSHTAALHCTILSIALTSSLGSKRQFPLLSWTAGTSTTSLHGEHVEHNPD